LSAGDRHEAVQTLAFDGQRAATGSTQGGAGLLRGRRFGHWTPRYIADRLALMAWQRRHPDAPWLTAVAVGILESWLRDTDVGLEWGSGRSTLWFGRRVRHLVSIEHAKVWHDRVSSWIARAGFTNVDHRLHCTERDYVAAVECLAPAGLDFVLVDGVFRDRCAIAAVSRLRPGGILVLDNANLYLPCRSRAPGSRAIEQGPASTGWELFQRQVRSWRRIWTTNGIWDTAIFVKGPDSPESGRAGTLP
jgi:Methyltransferase domain